jgi:hypothetical protein
LCYRNALISGDAVRIISAGGFYINYQRVSKIDEVLTEAVHILPNNVTLIRVGKWLFLHYDYKSHSFETGERKHPESDDDVIVFVVVVVQILQLLFRLQFLWVYNTAYCGRSLLAFHRNHLHPTSCESIANG